MLTFSDCLGKKKKSVREERELDNVSLQQSSASNFVNILPMTRYNSSSIHLTVAGTGMEDLSLQFRTIKIQRAIASEIMSVIPLDEILQSRYYVMALH